MINNKIPVGRNVFLISANIKSFGYIISNTDFSQSRSKLKPDSFFELYKFNPDVTRKIYDALLADTPRSIFAADLRGQSFLFCGSGSYANLFAFVKKLDIDASISATIINEHPKDKMIFINGEENGIIHADFNEIHDTVICFHKLLFGGSPNNVCDIERLMQDFIDGTPLSKPLNFNLTSPNGYIFSKSGFIMVLSYLYMTAARLQSEAEIKLSIEYNTSGSIIYADIHSKCDNIKDMLPKLDFLRCAMDAQSLSLFYQADSERIRLVFLPFYIDDGLYGVKAPFEPIDYLI